MSPIKAFAVIALLLPALQILSQPITPAWDYMLGVPEFNSYLVQQSGGITWTQRWQVLTNAPWSYQTNSFYYSHSPISAISYPTRSGYNYMTVEIPNIPSPKGNPMGHRIRFVYNLHGNLGGDYIYFGTGTNSGPNTPTWLGRYDPTHYWSPVEIILHPTFNPTTTPRIKLHFGFCSVGLGELGYVYLDDVQVSDINYDPVSPPTPKDFYITKTSPNTYKLTRSTLAYPQVQSIEKQSYIGQPWYPVPGISWITTPSNTAYTSIVSTNPITNLRLKLY